MTQPVGGSEEVGAQPSQAGGGYEAKLTKLDLSGGVDAGMVKNQIMETAKGLVGYDEDIEFDAPLMESGLTSNTAVLLRDARVRLPLHCIHDRAGHGEECQGGQEGFEEVR